MGEQGEKELMRQGIYIASIFCGLCAACTEVISTNTQNNIREPVDIQTLINENKSAFDITTSNNKNTSGRRIHPRFTGWDSNNLIWRNTSYLNSEIVGYIANTYNGNILEQSVRYDQAGIDGIWFTTDDPVFNYISHTGNTADITSITYDAAGPDGIWLNSDDRVRYYNFVKNNPDGSIQTEIYSIAGDDTIWFTPDDQIGWIIYKSAINSDQQQWATYLSPGPDNNWDTIDDNSVYEHALIQYDANGVLLRHVYYADIGLDNIAFTSDDTILFYHEYTYDDLGRISQNIKYANGPGTDGVWPSPDDSASSCKIQERDANDLPVRSITYLPGADGLCFSSDDRVWGYHDDSFVNGQLSNSTSYYGPGADAVWFTTDDIIIDVREFLPRI